MTYSVSYSFVPGTKARADEVNANFIDVLNHIEDTNTRIDNANTQLEKNSTQLDDITTRVDSAETEISQRANLSLSNLDEEGEKLLNSKANASLLDGAWVSANKALCTEKTISPGDSQVYALKSILPTENDVYEIILDGLLHTEVAHGSAYMYVKTPKTTSLAAFRVVTPNRYGSMQALAICQGKHSITVTNQPGSVEKSTYSLYIRAYRKVR